MTTWLFRRRNRLFRRRRRRQAFTTSTAASPTVRGRTLHFDTVHLITGTMRQSIKTQLLTARILIFLPRTKKVSELNISLIAEWIYGSDGLTENGTNRPPKTVLRNSHSRELCRSLVGLHLKKHSTSWKSQASTQFPWPIVPWPPPTPLLAIARVLRMPPAVSATPPTRPRYYYPSPIWHHSFTRRLQSTLKRFGFPEKGFERNLSRLKLAANLHSPKRSRRNRKLEGNQFRSVLFTWPISRESTESTYLV